MIWQVFAGALAVADVLAPSAVVVEQQVQPVVSTQTAPGQPVVRTDDQAKAIGSSTIPLWHGLSVGMDANTVATNLRQLPEIREAEARLKNGRPPEVKIKYNGGGISLFGFSMQVGLEFNGAGLSAVRLLSSGVCSDANSKSSLTELAKGIAEKYPQRITIVDQNGNEAEDQFAFTDGVTLVRMSIGVTAPPSAYDVARANVEAEIAKSRNPFDVVSGMNAIELKSRRDSALARCPQTEGVMTQVALLYSSRGESIAQQNAARVQEQERNELDKSKL